VCSLFAISKRLKAHFRFLIWYVLEIAARDHPTIHREVQHGAGFLLNVKLLKEEDL
jgi:hypothetical protein